MSPIVQKFPNFQIDRLSLPPRRSIQYSDRVEPATGRFGPQQWVLSRPLCRFNRFDLSRLPAPKRKAALALQLPQWSPFADSGYAIVWQDGYASVWCWDNSRVDAEIQKSNRIVKAQQKLPESLLRAPLQAGLRLLKCLNGAEGQYWQNGQLQVSRWWPQKPDQHAWLAFQRDCGIPAEEQQAQATLQDLPLLQKPWAKISAPGGAGGDVPMAEVGLYTALVFGLGLTTAVLGLQHHQVSSATAKRSAELAAIKSKAGKVFSAREDALNTLIRIKGIDSLEPNPQPLILMEAVAETLPKSGGAYLKEWEMTGSHLKISVFSQDGNVSGASYVQALDKTGLFSNIQIVTDAEPKTTGFSMTVRPVDPASAEEAHK
jgi:hypothetical protein